MYVLPISLKRFLFILLSLLILLLALYVFKSQWLWQLFYPLYYEEEVLTASREHSLDPYLLFAVIYVESKFDPDVESRSGAIGLMQIMPSTGAWIAKRRGITSYHVEDLYDPFTNISFGSWYLSHLLNSFHGQLTPALAAYNAGIGNVLGWIHQETWNGSWEERERIPFSETREYIEKVLSVYSRYESIYCSSRLGFFRGILKRIFSCFC